MVTVIWYFGNNKMVILMNQKHKSTFNIYLDCTVVILNKKAIIFHFMAENDMK